MTKTVMFIGIGVAIFGALHMIQPGPAVGQEKSPAVGQEKSPAVGQEKSPAVSQEKSPAVSQEKKGVTHHAPLLKTAVPDTKNQEVAVYHVTYEPGGINPRHFHPAAVTFHVLEGTGVWQEDGKEPVRLHAGESLLVPTGTIHSHWNPSSTDRLRFLEFIVAEKDKGRSIPKPKQQ